MTYRYQKIKLLDGGEQEDCIKRISDVAPFFSFIPFAEGNTDYQEYLKWLAEGNTPESADE